MKLRYSAPWIRRGLFYLLIVSPLLRGSNPYPNGSLTYRDDLLYLHTNPGVGFCQTIFGESSTKLYCSMFYAFVPEIQATGDGRAYSSRVVHDCHYTEILAAGDGRPYSQGLFTPAAVLLRINTSSTSPAYLCNRSVFQCGRSCRL